MNLKYVYFKGMGPFAAGEGLEIDDDVTVLTGANDTGKSVTLHLISLLNGNQNAREDDRNSDAYDAESGVFYTCKVRETSSEDSDSDSDIHKVELLYDPEDGSLDVNRVFDRKGNEIENHHTNRPNVRVIWIRVAENIHREFRVRDANNSEKLLLRMVFKTTNENDFKNLDTRRLRTVSRELSANLATIVPDKVGLQFQIQTLPDDVPKIAIDLEDNVGAITPIDQRGSGYNRLLSYLLLLSAIDLNSGQVVILLDEPETSLHADAQHSFRVYLDRTGCS